MPLEDLPTALGRLLLVVLNSDTVAALGALWRLSQRIWGSRAYGSPYELLSYEVQLELQDTEGEIAVVHKRERVRFLQNNIIAYQDQAWGDGEIFTDYQCAPGIPVDRYREGHRYRILISLRETKNRGDTMEFTSQRTVLRGFTTPEEDFQNEVDHPMHQLSMRVIFPKGRLPREVTLIERHANRTRHLGREQQLNLPDGRQQVTWTTKTPRLFEIYILHWQW